MCFSATARAVVVVRGRVGLQPADLYARLVGDDIARVDCANNMPFWLELDLVTGTLRGGRHNFPGLHRGQFRVERRRGAGADAADAFRITHTACPQFWVELAL